jgi:hypothetical protein
MQILTVNNNFFNGSIAASSIGFASQLATLDISSNGFSGPLPQEIGKLLLMQKLVASDNKLSGFIPPEISNLSQLNGLDLSQNSFTGLIPATLGNCTQLSTLNLSTNLLSGEIPSELGELISLTVLDLSHNSLSGDVPAVLSSLPLENLDLSYNNLSGVLPSGLFDVANVKGNPDLCEEGSSSGDSTTCVGGGSSLQPAAATSSSKSSNGGGGGAPMVFVVVGAFVAATIILVVGSCWFYRRYKTFQEERCKGLGASWQLTSFHKMVVRDYEIAEFCNDPDNVIGSGGSGKVYKAVLGNGQAVAVKKLGWGESKPAGDHAAVHDHGFKAEVIILDCRRHAGAQLIISSELFLGYILHHHSCNRIRSSMRNRSCFFRVFTQSSMDTL